MDVDYLQRVGFLAQPAVFWRRSAFEQLGPLDESLRYVADCDYWMRAAATHLFVKVDECLAVERDHRDTLRDAHGERVWAELASVRARYVTTSGLHHQRISRRHRIRTALWTRWYTLRLVSSASLPGDRRPRQWARLLASGQTRVRRFAMLVRAIPRIGPRLVDEVMDPSRHWLEPVGR
jgi:hypothetical protein